QYWKVILLAVPIFMAAKIAIIYLLCRVFRSNHNDAVRIAFLLPQGGEFAFVLFSAASAASIISSALGSELVAAVTVSMALTPLSVFVGSKLLIKDKTVDEIEENFEGAGSDVLMIGFSRYGQIASQI